MTKGTKSTPAMMSEYLAILLSSTAEAADPTSVLLSSMSQEIDPLSLHEFVSLRPVLFLLTVTETEIAQ